MNKRTPIRLAALLCLTLGLAKAVDAAAGADGSSAARAPSTAAKTPPPDSVQLPEGRVTGTTQVWHALNLDFTGPTAAESDDPNPFTHYRLDAVFVHHDSGDTVTRPGFFAADGDAAETSAVSGGVWRVTFTPTRPGRWTYAAALTRGPNVALLPAWPDLSDPATTPGATTGAIEVDRSTAAAPDLRAHGTLHHDGTRYLKFAGSGRAFLKVEHGSPENLLAYGDFDQTFDTGGHGSDPSARFLHAYEPHARDAQPHDPTWQDGRGVNLLGAINYLASRGVNSSYFLTYTLDGGDGKDVWPWTAPDVRDRFDVSKLAQWDRVFAHQQAKGMVLNLLTQETENDHGLDGGDLGDTRKLYYRELVARFGHHPGLIWHLGEENTNSPEQVRDFANELRRLDAYRHPIALHTYPGQHEQRYAPLLGYENLDVASLQVGRPEGVPAATREWLKRSAEAGHPWAAPLDEIGPADRGVDPDVTFGMSRSPATDPTADLAPNSIPNADGPFPRNNQRAIRHHSVWGNLMAGGSGNAFYFGYQNPHADLNLEDFRSRDATWITSHHAVKFFQKYLPFTEMQPANGLTDNPRDFVLAQSGVAYAVYLPYGGSASVDLSDAEGTFDLYWYDPVRGGDLRQNDMTTRVEAGAKVYLGDPPGDPYQDWAVLLTRRDPADATPEPAAPAKGPAPAVAPTPTDAAPDAVAAPLVVAEDATPVAPATGLAAGAANEPQAPAEAAPPIVIEAENFATQADPGPAAPRQWYRFDAQSSPEMKPDPDPPHLDGASGDAYLELLPDTRHTHSEPLQPGENFSNQPGLCVLTYPVHFAAPGRYYVWVRAYSTGSEDNGLHVGLNGEWPDSGQRMQWCDGKNTWRWESKQRVPENHCGIPHAIYLDVDTVGDHTVQFSMREDGFEFDAFLLTTDRDFVPGK